MSYNLTPTQKKAVRWLVDKTKSGELADSEVLYAFHNSGGVALPSDNRSNVELPDYLSRSILEVLETQSLVHIRLGSGGSPLVTLTGKAYKAVDNDFADSPEPASNAQPVFNLHGDLHGDNARINIQSQDQSINVVSKSAGELFAELRQTIEAEVGDESVREDLLSSVREMEQANSKSSYLKAYGFFIGLAASHVELLEPFLGALWQLYQNL